MPDRIWIFLPLAIIGISLIAGYLTAFRDRLYLALLGGAFVVLGIDVLIPRGQVLWLKITLLVVMAGLFLWAAVIAVRETAARLEQLRQSREAREMAFFETLKAAAEKERQRKQQAENSGSEGKSE